MDDQMPSRVIGAGRRKGGASCGGAMTGGVSSIIRSPAVHEAKMELAQHRALEGYGATPAQRHRANQKATHRHMMGSASTGGAMTGGFGAMDLIFPAHSLFGFGHQGGAMTGGLNPYTESRIVNGLAPSPYANFDMGRVNRDDLPRLITEPHLERNLKRTIGLGGASTGGMLYHGMPHPTMKGVHWYEHPQAVGGGFWSDTWDKIKNAGKAVYENVLTPIGHLARRAVPVVGNLIGTEFGLPIAGTLADQGLKAIGLGRRRKSIHPHGMRHPHYEGISWHHHPHALHGGFWLWDKIKEGANWVGDKVNQGVNWVGDHIGDLARKAVEPVGNFIGKQFGVDNAGSTINSGLNMIGVGRPRRRGRNTASREHRREGELLHEAMEAHQAEGRLMRGGASTGGLYGQVKRGGTRARAVSARLGILPDGDYAFDSHIGGAMTGGMGSVTAFLNKQNKVRTPEQQAKHDKKVERINNWNAHLHGGASTGESRSARGAIVKKVMAERGCSLPEASRIVKAEGLY